MERGIVLGDRCFEHGTDECLGCVTELEAEVERLRDQVEGLLSVEFENRKEIERLRNEILEYEGRERFDRTEIERLWAERDALARILEDEGYPVEEEA